MNWNEFSAHLEAMKDGSGAKVLAEKETRLEGLIQSAREAKIKLSTMGAREAEIEQKRTQLDLNIEASRLAEQKLSDQATLLATREADISRREKAFSAHSENVKHKLNERETRIAALEGVTNGKSNAINAKIEHLRQAGIQI